MTVSAHQALIKMTAAKSPHLSCWDPSTANMLLELERGSRATQPQVLDYHYLRSSLGQKPPGFQQDFTGNHLAHHTTLLQSLLAGHAKCFQTTTAQNNIFCLLQPPQGRRRRGRGLSQAGETHTVLAVVLRAHLCNITSIFLLSTTIMGCIRVGWRKEDCSNTRKMKRRWRTSVRTIL